MGNAAALDLTPFSVLVYRHFGGTLKMEATLFFETTVST
jgi:hypothetical protein